MSNFDTSPLPLVNCERLRLSGCRLPGVRERHQHSQGTPFVNIVGELANPIGALCRTRGPENKVIKR